jgi:molybdopterin converting factor small subunit
MRSSRIVSTLGTQYFGPSRSTLGFEARVLEQVEEQVAKLKEELKAQLEEEK